MFVKKICLTTALNFIFCMVIAQQPSQESKVKFGIKGGLNASTVAVSLSDGESGAYVDYNSDYMYRTGLNFGMLVEVPVTKIFSFQPELLFSFKGMRNESHLTISLPQTSGYGPFKLRGVSHFTLYYLEIPLYVKAGVRVGGYGKLTLGLGPYLAYGVGGKMKFRVIEGDSYGYESGEKNIFTDGELKIYADERSRLSYTSIAIHNREPYFRHPIKRFDAGLSAIVGYEFNTGVFATIGYEWGMMNTMKNPDNSWEGEVSGTMYNRTASIVVGYRF